MPDLQVGGSREKNLRTKDSGKNSVKTPESKSKARSQSREPSGQFKAKVMSTVPLGFISKSGVLGRDADCGQGQKCQW